MASVCQQNAETDGAAPRATGPRAAETSAGKLAGTGPEHLVLARVELVLRRILSL